MTSKKLGDLNKRLLVSLVTALCIGTLIAFSHNIFVEILLVFCVAAFVGIGVWEYAQFARAKELRPAVKSMVVIAVCEVFACFSSHKLLLSSLAPAIVLALGAVLFFLIHFKDTSDALIHVAVEFFGVCYVAIPLSCMLAILYPISATGLSWDGRWWFVYLILVTKITDVAAYFVGRIWGKRKLAPFLSPKKTIEGAVAGFFCAILFSVLISYLAGAMNSSLFHLPLSASIILGASIGIAGQVGDLAESLLKRDAVVKDSNALPGLGGVLDMVDSILLTAPIVYFYLKLQSVAL
jgi:phosphatidate cytidylyltransferase